MFKHSKRVKNLKLLLLICILLHVIFPALADSARISKPTSPKTWPSNTSIILKLDGIDRYFFLVSTKLEGLQRDKITTLLNQGEFAVIQERLKNQPDQLKRYWSCLDYETSNAGRSSPSKKAFSLEVIATLCLASRSTSIDSKGYIHILKSGKTPEILLISSNDPNYNSALDIGIPSLNATKDKNGKYADDAKRILPDYCGGAFADPKACMKVCEKNIDAPICRSCSRFDSGDTKFVNLKRISVASPLFDLFDMTGGSEAKSDFVIAQTYLEPEKLSEGYKQTGFDISQVRLFKKKPEANEDVRTAICFPCPKDAKIDKLGRCMKDSCDIGEMIGEGTRCKSKDECASNEILVNGTCKASCETQCNREKEKAESNLKSLTIEVESIKAQRYSTLSATAEAVRKYGLAEVLQQFERARKTITNEINYLNMAATVNCTPSSAEEVCHYSPINTSSILQMLKEEKICGIGKIRIGERCADSKCSRCRDNANYFASTTRSHIGQCKEPELELALRLLQERYIQSFELFIEQCIADPQVAKQCEAIRNPSDQEIAELLKGYGVICFPTQNSSPQPTPE